MENAWMLKEYAASSRVTVMRVRRSGRGGKNLPGISARGSEAEGES
jgi:hypothetical protein